MTNVELKRLENQFRGAMGGGTVLGLIEEVRRLKREQRVVGCCFAGVAAACPRHERKDRRS